MSKPVVHVLAAPLGLVQDCIRCGAVVIDNRGAVLPDGGSAAYFATGTHVGVDRGCTYLTSDAPTCAVRDPADVP